MGRTHLPSVERLRQLVRYEAKSGKLFWLPRDDNPKGWNKRRSGKEALTSITQHGRYRYGMIDGQFVYAHRVVFALHHGEVPHTIDHINGDPTDNRLENLRAVPEADNHRNCARSQANISGCLGVTWDKQRVKWFAKITFDGKQIPLGRFDSLSDAVRVRKEAEAHYGFHPNHGRAAKL